MQGNNLRYGRIADRNTRTSGIQGLENGMKSIDKVRPGRLMLEGMGSLIDLSPHIRTEDLIITDPAQRIQYIWERVGRSMYQALDDYETTTQKK